MPVRSRRKPEEAYLAYARRPKRHGASSQYRGVSFRKQTQLWIAQLYWRGKRYFLGSFQSELEAALAYNLHAERLIGELALLNDLSSDPGLSPRQAAPGPGQAPDRLRGK